ncbi:TetR/AcrR family transcriptional regulator [Gordonia humi]|uniref:AcrR family transcriptional regulator n=1 Tax=Gordonia humi TaxID=686429 RepID=A0A840EXX3_9ACTN|nr:TetR/AcrR family transcriptional regulator [Gordonia humi]MBB4135133.1 AcrR family transcriptional regulator [Gordonia humi]
MPRPRGGTQSAPLSSQDILDAALRVVERSSLDELTVKAVADECGVTPPAIHYHLRGDVDLATRVVEAVAQQITVRFDSAASWQDRYIALVLAMDRAFLRYPGTGSRALTSGGQSPAATELTDTALDILRSAGFDDRESGEIFAATYLLYVGWLSTRRQAENNIIHPSLRAAGMSATGHDDAKPLISGLRCIFTGHIPRHTRGDDTE